MSPWKLAGSRSLCSAFGYATARQLLLIAPFLLAACAEVDTPMSPETVEAEAALSPAVIQRLAVPPAQRLSRLASPRPLGGLGALDAWHRSCEEGNPRLTRLTAVPDPDGINLALRIEGRTCGADVSAPTYEPLDEEGAVFYLRGPWIEVLSLTVDADDRFVMEARARSSCGNVQTAHGVIVQVGSASISATVQDE
jgi:hypothetical protein